MFLISNRIPEKNSKKRERKSVHLTNLGAVIFALLMIFLFGWKAYLLIQLPIILIAATAGVWLFYVQHQYEDVYWAKHEDWDYDTAALEGSSYYKLPAVLRWFSGNIGFHHVHHFNSRIPNYFLKKCHEEIVKYRKVEHISILSSLKSLRFRLWDESQGKMVGFGHVKRLKAA